MLSSSSGPAFLAPATDKALSVSAPIPPTMRTAALGLEKAAAQTHRATLVTLATATVAGATLVRAARRKQLARRSRHCVAAVSKEAETESSGVVGRAGLLRSAAGAGFGSLLDISVPMSASAKSLEEAQKAMVGLGLPELAPSEGLPNYWKYVVEPYGLASDANFGKFKLGSTPKAVMFICPQLWVITRPTIDFNGSAGTIGANDYGKGDSATLFVDTEFKGNLNDMKRPDFRNEMLKALTLKGKGFIEDLKVSKVRDGSPGYKIIEYSYEIESEAGFSINRDGIASFTQAGDDGSLQIFWTGVVTPRYGKEMEKTLNMITGSFRVGQIPKGIAGSVQTRDFTRKDEQDAIDNGSAVPFVQYNS